MFHKTRLICGDRHVHPDGDCGRAGEPPEAPKSRPVALVELIATLALALDLIAVTAVSIASRAPTFGAQTDAAGAPLAIALFVGLLLTGMGGLTAIMADDRDTPRD
jgi:hypothetical protein